MAHILSAAESGLPNHLHPNAEGGYPVTLLFTNSGGNSAHMGQGASGQDGERKWAGWSGAYAAQQAHSLLQPWAAFPFGIRI